MFRAFRAISTDGMPSFGNYSQVRQYFERTKPFRGEERRPLRGKREKHKWLEYSSIDDTYICGLYHTPVVIYYPDGSVGVRCYDSQSTVQFVCAVTPSGMYADTFLSQMYVTVKAKDNDEQFFRRARGEIIRFRRDEAGFWSTDSEVDTVYTVRVDRKRAKQVRKIAQPFTSWVDAQILFGDGLVVVNEPFAECRQRFSVDYPGVASYLLTEKELRPGDYGLFLNMMAKPRAHQGTRVWAVDADYKPALDKELLAYGGALRKVALPRGAAPIKHGWAGYMRNAVEVTE